MMALSSSSLFLLASFLAFWVPSAIGFVGPSALHQLRSPLLSDSRASAETPFSHHHLQQKNLHRMNSDPNNFMFKKYKTYTGEIINPYKTLNVHRSADRKQIRDKYISLSKRYHPDVVRHKDILPGSCNNLEDVRDQWERIKLAYEILSDKKMRTRYDRHEVIADPKAAMQRAVVDAAGSAVKGVGKGIFGIGKGLFAMGARAVADSMNSSSNNKNNTKAL